MNRASAERAEDTHPELGRLARISRHGAPILAATAVNALLLDHLRQADAADAQQRGHTG